LAVLYPSLRININVFVSHQFFLKKDIWVKCGLSDYRGDIRHRIDLQSFKKKTQSSSLILQAMASHYFASILSIKQIIDASHIKGPQEK
jgi:sulfopyruvate decarboxylase TPP-binding subunit